MVQTAHRSSAILKRLFVAISYYLIYSIPYSTLYSTSLHYIARGEIGLDKVCLYNAQIFTLDHPMRMKGPVFSNIQSKILTMRDAERVPRWYTQACYGHRQASC